MEKVSPCPENGQEAPEGRDPVAPPTPPCPSWCTKPAGHEYDSINGDASKPLDFGRYHAAFEPGWANYGARVEAFEVASPAGKVYVEPATVSIRQEDLIGMSGGEAGELAQVMSAAADLLDEVNTHGCPRWCTKCFTDTDGSKMHSRPDVTINDRALLMRLAVGQCTEPRTGALEAFEVQLELSFRDFVSVDEARRALGRAFALLDEADGYASS